MAAAGETSATDEALGAPLWCALGEAVWGSLEGSDVDRWFANGFNLADEATGMPFGLRQRSGGPCGVLAAVQGYMLYKLLFGDDLTKAAEEWAVGGRGRTQAARNAAAAASGADILTRLRADLPTLTAALVHAIAFVIWQAREGEGSAPAKVLRYCGPGAAPGAPLFTLATPPSAFRVCTFPTFPALEAFVGCPDMLAQWGAPSGVAQLVFSAVLSRGLRSLGEDMDEPSPLVARFGHCTMELTNLLLIGAAHSGAFDGEEDIGGLVLRGVTRQPIVGYLTTVEALRYLRVGSRLKTPLVPVWVVGSESHMTVLFGGEAELVEESPSAPLSAAFKAHDTHDNGFVPVGSLGPILVAAGLGGLAADPAGLAALGSRLDTMGAGVITWAEFWAVVAPLFAASLAKGAGAGGSGADGPAAAQGASSSSSSAAAFAAAAYPSSSSSSAAAAAAGAGASSLPSSSSSFSAAAGAAGVGGPPSFAPSLLRSAFEAADAAAGGNGFLTASELPVLLSYLVNRTRGPGALSPESTDQLELALGQRCADLGVILWDDLISACAAAGVAVADPLPSSSSSSSGGGGGSASSSAGNKRGRVQLGGTGSGSPLLPLRPSAPSPLTQSSSLFAAIDLSMFGVGSGGGGSKPGGAKAAASTAAAADSHSVTALSPRSGASTPPPLLIQDGDGGVGSGGGAYGPRHAVQRSFELFHYNGLEDRGRVPRLTRLSLVQSDTGGGMMAEGCAGAGPASEAFQPSSIGIEEATAQAMALSSSSQAVSGAPGGSRGGPGGRAGEDAMRGLLGVLRTKWPGVAMQYEGPAPSLD